MLIVPLSPPVAERRATRGGAKRRNRWYRGAHAKSDAIDARLIVEYGRDSEGLRLHKPPRAAQLELRELVGRRTQLREMAEAEQTRSEHVRCREVTASLRAIMKVLDTQIAAIKRRIAALIAADAAFARTADLMQSVKGVGLVTAATVLAYLPEIGTVSRGTIAALAGLAPFDRDSGTLKGRRHIFAGRAEVRACLYMPALVAMRYNPHLKTMAERIKAKGNPFKVAATAVMRKLLVILNAVVASGQPCKLTTTAPKAAVASA